MIAENIKTALGEELAAKVETALKGKGKEGKDLDLVCGNDGTFVPADKHDLAKGQAASAEKALKAAAEALKAVGGSGDPAKIADDVKTAQTTFSTLQETHQKEIAQIRKNTALRMALADKVHDPADIIGLLDPEKIEVDDAGALKTPLDEMLKPIRETKGYLFKEPEKAPDIKGTKPAEPAAKNEPAAPASGPVVI